MIRFLKGELLKVRTGPDPKDPKAWEWAVCEEMHKKTVNVMLLDSGATHLFTENDTWKQKSQTRKRKEKDMARMRVEKAPPLTDVAPLRAAVEVNPFQAATGATGGNPPTIYVHRLLPHHIVVDAPFDDRTMLATKYDFRGEYISSKTDRPCYFYTSTQTDMYIQGISGLVMYRAPYQSPYQGMSPLRGSLEWDDTDELGMRGLASIKIGASTTMLHISSSSALDFSGDAIVNAANPRCLGGGGIDGAITAAGGRTLRDARSALPLLDDAGNRCFVGDAKLTCAGGTLKCSHVIHAVGANFHETGASISQLEDAYKSALRVGVDAGCKTIAFCILSGGIYRGHHSLDRIIHCGLSSIVNFIRTSEHIFERVYFCMFTSEEKHCALRVLNLI